MENAPERREVVMTVAELYMKRRMEKGFKEGKLQEKYDVAIKLITKGLSMKDIIDVTGLTRDEVVSLKRIIDVNKEPM